MFRGNVRLTGAGGLEMKTAEATYTHADGMVVVPGAVEFAKGRMTGSGVGATYDQKRDVFWIKDKARIDVTPAKDGTGGLEATAASIGLARAEHYIQLQGSARITGEGRVVEASDIMVRLTDDDERVRMLELRGNSRITGGAAGPTAMSARDIDLTYGEDGRTLQHARLVENAAVQLAGAAGKRISGNTIDIGLGPDGSTMTSLTANERVQVDLPAEGEAAAKTIRSAALTAAGANGGGLQAATFSGGVNYRETRAGRRNVPASERQATSQTLIIETQPGLGAIQKADFRGNVRFTEAPDFVAEGQQGIYDVARDRLDLVPADGQPGPASPTVADGRVTVAARTIQFSLTTRELAADTRVRSTIHPQKGKSGRGAREGKLPSMLASDQPVNVTSNRLAYNGASSKAVYTGNVVLWQGVDTKITAPTIEIDDKAGNLAASGGVTTVFMFQETDPKTGARRADRTTGASDTFTYDDTRRLATYTTKATITGLQGIVSGEKIELFMKGSVNELERAEAYGTNGNVTVREGNRLVTGAHLTYTAADDQYLMVGTPVEVIEAKNGSCTSTLGQTATFNRATERASVQGSAGGVPMNSSGSKPCPAGFAR